jgi:hypothetical protein
VPCRCNASAEHASAEHDQLLQQRDREASVARRMQHSRDRSALPSRPLLVSIGTASLEFPDIGKSDVTTEARQRVMIDEIARERAISRYGLAESVHVPVAAVDEAAISTYVGEIKKVLSGGSARKAFLVYATHPPARDPRLPIWDLDNCDILHQQRQVWVDVTYTRYRKAYRAAFPDEKLGDQILSHAMNRRIAALKGFQFVRITPISRAANSSSILSEGWGVALHKTSGRQSGAFIEYADLAALMLMLDISLGGGVMDVVNEGQKLVRARPA